MPSRLKGATILNTLSILRENMDRQRFQSLVDACPPATQQFLQRTLMAVEWVSVDIWGPMLAVIFERLTNRDELKFRRFMRNVCKRDFAGPYRVYVLNADTTALLHKLQAIWSAYFDSGSLFATPKETVKDRQSYLLELRGLEAESVLYLFAVHAYIEQLLILVDAKNPVVTRQRDLQLVNRLSCDFTVTFG